MKLHINQVINAQAESATVSFSSTYGNATSRWVGTPPEVGCDYDVEIDVPGILRWNTEISKAQTSVQSIFEDDGKVCIFGQLKSIDEAGVAVIQLHDDMILVEVKGIPSPIPDYVLIKVPFLQLFDANL